MSEEINILVEKEKLTFCRLIVIKFEFQTILAVDHIQIFVFFHNCFCIFYSSFSKKSTFTRKMAKKMIKRRNSKLLKLCVELPNKSKFFIINK